MRNRKYWGIVTLIILLLGVTAVLLLRDTDTEPEVIYKTDVEPARKTETQIAEKRTAKPGFEMVQHGDHWHEVPISEPPVVTDEEVTPEVVAKPDWIYDPDREKPDGWDPKLVWENSEVKIDFNYFRPMTEEEQAEYERLKSMENPEDHGIDVNNEADLRFMAIVNMQSDLLLRARNARGTLEGDRLFAEYENLYGFTKYFLPD
ncbi:hypothetical protein C6497_11425 [Candidatus Poribacteria bacterium]|nr:MAG: hypothetical protein C6497_11425 [Candidatus Poribacteria bacterium]